MRRFKTSFTWTARTVCCLTETLGAAYIDFIIVVKKNSMTTLTANAVQLWLGLIEVL